MIKQTLFDLLPKNILSNVKFYMQCYWALVAVSGTGGLTAKENGTEFFNRAEISRAQMFGEIKQKLSKTSCFLSIYVQMLQLSNVY